MKSEIRNLHSELRGTRSVWRERCARAFGHLHFVPNLKRGHTAHSKRFACFGPCLSALKISIVLSLPVFVVTGCRQEMYDQPYYRPLHESRFFANRMASRPPVPNTVPRGHLNEAEDFFTGKIGTNLVEIFPMEITHELLARGRQRYEIYCSPCHAATGNGQGMIVQRGFPAPPSYHIDRLREAPVGHFYDVITHGYGMMYPYGNRVAPADRWAITAYIRALQLSQHANLELLTPGERAKLETAK